MPLSCEKQYTIQDSDNCWQLEYDYNLAEGAIRQYSPWVDTDCLNLQSARELLRNVFCLSPQGGTHNKTGTSVTTTPGRGGYVEGVIAPPVNTTVVTGTTIKCGLWYTATGDESCVEICLKSEISANLFKAVNPSLASDCDNNLISGAAYCVGPDHHWNDTSFWASDSSNGSATSSGAVLSPTPAARR